MTRSSTTTGGPAEWERHVRQIAHDRVSMAPPPQKGRSQRLAPRADEFHGDVEEAAARVWKTSAVPAR